MSKNPQTRRVTFYKRIALQVLALAATCTLIYLHAGKATLSKTNLDAAAIIVGESGTNGSPLDLGLPQHLS